MEIIQELFENFKHPETLKRKLDDNCVHAYQVIQVNACFKVLGTYLTNDSAYEHMEDIVRQCNRVECLEHVDNHDLDGRPVRITTEGGSVYELSLLRLKW